MRTVVVIGADKGIARAIAERLHARGERVVAACLGDGAALAAQGIAVAGGVDVTSDEAVGKLAAGFAAEALRIDDLYHVAGVLPLDSLGAIDMAEMRRAFEINAIGPVRVVQALVPFLGTGSKVGIVTSRVGSLADNASGGMYAYRMSKAAANMACLNLHYDLTRRGIAVLALHPGTVATDLTRDIPGITDAITPAAAAEGLIARMDELTLATSGRFVHADGSRLPW